MKLNVRLLRRIKKHILAEPKRIDMSLFAMNRPRSAGGPACGTVGCIAGWAVLLSNPKKKWYDIATGPDLFARAEKLLGLRRKESWELFTCDGIETEIGTKEHALETAERIDQFISSRNQKAHEEEK